LRIGNAISSDGIPLFGRGADRSENIPWRLENGELDEVNPKVIVLLAGTNNVGNRESPEGQEARTEVLTRGLEAVLRLMQSKPPDATIILTAIFPRNDNIKVMPVVDRMNANLAHLAGGDLGGKKTRYLDINRKLAAENGKQSGLAASFTPGLSGVGGCFQTDSAGTSWPPASEDHAPPTSDPSARN
jgi:hypothetical protein